MIRFGINKDNTVMGIILQKIHPVKRNTYLAY